MVLNLTLFLEPIKGLKILKKGKHPYLSYANGQEGKDLICQLFHKPTLKYPFTL